MSTAMSMASSTATEAGEKNEDAETEEAGEKNEDAAAVVVVQQSPPHPEAI